MSSNDPIQPITPAQEAADKESAKTEGYVHRVLEEIDVLGNVVTGGKQDETISSRLAREDTQGHGFTHEVGVVGSRILDVFQKDHGAMAEAGDLERAEIVEQLEESTGTLPTK